MKEYINSLKIAEISGKKIGLFRTICSIFGGLSVAYLGMTLFTFILPIDVFGALRISTHFYCILWAIIALWISLSKTRYIALLRSIVPSLIFGIILIVLFYI